MNLKKLNIGILVIVFAALNLSGCATRDVSLSNKYSQQTAISGKSGAYKIGKPYKIMGKWYYPKEDYAYSEVGMASWYGEDFHAKYTANGEVYDMNTLTAAHRTLPLPSVVRVTNLENGRSLVVRVNDRGPFAKNRIIDVSKRGAQLLGYKEKGITKVKVELLEEESKQLKAALTGKPMETLVAKKSQPIPKMATTQYLSGYTETAQTSNGNYFVQAGAFSNKDSADDLSSHLKKFGEINVLPADVDGNRYYRVRVGPFNHEVEANVTLSKIKNYGVYNAKLVQD